MAVFRGFYLMIRTALFALGVSFFIFYDVVFAVTVDNCNGTVVLYSASKLSDFRENAQSVYIGGSYGWGESYWETNGSSSNTNARHLFGSAKNSSLNVDKGTAMANPPSGGNYCWCRLEGDSVYGGDDIQRTFVVSEDSWISVGYVYEYAQPGDILNGRNCPWKCQVDFRHETNVRNAILNTLVGECYVGIYKITLNDGYSNLLSFYLNNSSHKIYSDLDCTHQISNVSSPTRSGLLFDGYYRDNDNTKVIDRNGNYLGDYYYITASSSETWYAQWKNVVNLYSNCPSGSNTLVTTIGVKQNEYMPEYDSNGNRLSKPTCPGYRFLGYWDQTSGGDQYYDHTLLIDDEDGGLDTKWNKTGGGNLYAHWETMPDGFHVEIEDTDSFGFYINAAGSYRVYWGDGEYTDVINTRPLTTQNLTKHDYDYDDNYTVTITRLSNEYAGYNSDTQIPAIGFSYDPGYIIGISGSLGSVFPTLSSTSVSGAITQPSFYGTFEDCEYITELPEDLFSGISGTPVPHMFDSTFEDCDSLTSVPGQLFPSFTANSISNADYMFYETFYDCGNLRYIDSDLFAGVSGAPAPHMFDSTFEETLLALVPSGLFSNINGPVQESLFEQTFASTSIETVPADLFAGISGFPAPQAFYETFYGSHVTFFTYSDNRPRISFIPPDFFGSIDVSNYHTDLTSTVTYNNHTYQDTSSWVAYDIFGSTNVLEECPSGYEEYYTGFEDEYSPKVSCILSANCASNKMHYNGTCVDPDFTLTTTSDTSEFAFSITASGTWYVDWGDGTVEQIHRENIANSFTNGGVDNTRYYHEYDTDNTYVIKMKGLATDYSGNDQIAAINFSDAGYEDYIASISGSLGKMFPTINGNSPSFYAVFNDAENLVGELPSDLFSEVTTCRDYMFQGAFTNSEITKIPSGLFSSITDGCQSMFEETFQYCDELTTVEQNAFPRLQYCGDRMYAYTFDSCPKLTSIPSDLFENQQGGCMEMFENTFSSSGLTSIPEELFASINSTGEAMFDSTFAHTKITEVPSNLFPNIEWTDIGLFGSMFAYCENLTTIPADLFSHFDGSMPSENAFNNMFIADTNMEFFKYSDGTKVSYIPSTFFGGLEDSGYTGGDNVAKNMFGNASTYSSYSNGVYVTKSNNTKILEACPQGTTVFDSKFKTEYAPKVSCIPVNAYTITYNLYGGTNNASNPESYTATSSTITFAAPTKTGYTFDGWYTDSTFTTPITQIPTGSTGNKTLYAKWVMNLAYIYNDDNNTVNNSMCTYNNNFTVPGIDNEEEVKPGYKFMGWIYRKQ